MQRLLSMDTEMLVGESEVVVEVSQAKVGAWTLEVTLLLEGLVESITLRSSGGAGLVLEMLPEVASGARRAVVSRLSAERLRFELPRTQAEYLQAVLLRAYRDDMAEVSHTHIEGELGDTPYALTVLFGAARPPMSPEEANKLLRD